MTPEKFFDYLEGKLPPVERERSNAPSCSDPELSDNLSPLRQIHRSLERPPDESAATTRLVRADVSSPRPLPCSWP